jgi:hypothetical protein
MICPFEVVTRVDANEDGVTVVTRPSASVVTTPTAEVAVVSVAIEMDTSELLDEGVTNRVEVLNHQQ